MNVGWRSRVTVAIHPPCKLKVFVRAGEAHKESRYAEVLRMTRAMRSWRTARQNYRVARLLAHVARLHHGRETRPPRPITMLAAAARSPASQTRELVASNSRHWLAPVGARLRPLRTLHFVFVPRCCTHSIPHPQSRRQAIDPGGVSTVSSAAATPARSLAELTAAPKASLPTGSSRRVAPLGSVPSLPRCLWRQPVGSPRTAEPRGPRDPSRALSDCELSAPATMLLRARLGLRRNCAD